MLRRIPRMPGFVYLTALTVGLVAGFIARSAIVAGVAALVFFLLGRAVG
jgi:hypothetical protein